MTEERAPQSDGARTGSQANATSPSGDGLNADQLWDAFVAAFDGGGWPAVAVAIHDAIQAQGEVPVALQPVLAEVMAMWTGAVPRDAARMAELRVAMWTFLDEKHENSTRIIDREDRTVRAALVLAYSDAEVKPASDHYGWAAEMLAAEPWPRVTRYF